MNIFVSYPKALAIVVLLSLLFVGTLPGSIVPEASAQTDVENEQVDIKREIYFKRDANYPKLPGLLATNPKPHPENWARKQFGVDENPRGIIGNAVVNYYFQTPKGWKVENTNQRFSSDEDSVIFRLKGSSGVWGAIYKINVTDDSIEDERDLARYFLEHRSSYIDMLEGVDGSEINLVDHLLHGLGLEGSDVINQYESYSTVELPDNSYAGITQYELGTDWGYVIDIYIPTEDLDGVNRTTAYLIGKSFAAYRFR